MTDKGNLILDGYLAVTPERNRVIYIRNLQNTAFALLLVLFASWQVQGAIPAAQPENIAKHSSAALIRLEQECDGDMCG